MPQAVGPGFQSVANGMSSSFQPKYTKLSATQADEVHHAEDDGQRREVAVQVEQPGGNAAALQQPAGERDAPDDAGGHQRPGDDTTRPADVPRQLFGDGDHAGKPTRITSVGGEDPPVDPEALEQLDGAVAAGHDGRLRQCFAAGGAHRRHRDRDDIGDGGRARCRDR